MIRRGRPFSGAERNTMFLNLGGARFDDASSAAGFDFDDDGRGLALLDHDGDGDLDVWTSNRTAPRVRLLRNDIGSRNRSISILLEGDGRVVNRDAVGARLELLHGDGAPRSVRTVRAGEGYLSQSTRWQVFGLAPGDSVTGLRVRWPDGSREHFEGLRPGGRYVVRMGGAVLDARRRAIAPLAAGALAHAAAERGNRSLMSSRMPLPFDVGEAGVRRVILLWSERCSTCRAQLDRLDDEAGRLSAAGLSLVRLCVDDDEAGSALLRSFQAVNDALLEDHRPLPVPFALLVDERDEVAAIYRGEIGLDRLLADTALLDADAAAIRAAAAPYPGRWLEAPRPLDLRRAGDVFLRAGLPDPAERLYASALAGHEAPRTWYNRAAALRGLGRADEAAAAYRRSLELDPDFVLAHAGLARCRREEGDLAGAVELLERATELDPRWAEAWYDLGILRVMLQTPGPARAAFERALELKGDFADAWLWLARLHEDDGRLDDALRALRAARGARGGARDLLELGRFRARRGRLRAAERLYRGAIEAAPDGTEARLELALLCSRQERHDEAIEILREALLMDGENAPVHHALGVVLARSGALREAADAFARAVELDPGLVAAREHLERARRTLAGSEGAEKE